MKRALLVCLTALFSITVTLVMGELLARSFVRPSRLPDPPPPRSVDAYKVNPYFFFARPYLQVYIPGARYLSERSSFKVVYQINRRGFRGPEIAAREATTLKRLLVIGDSLVEGHGVEFDDVFTQVLGVNMRSAGWEVINAGVAGGSPIYYAANVPRYMAVQPDTVLMMIFENDLTDDRSTEAQLFSLPILDEEDRLVSGSTGKGGCCESRLYTSIRRLWKEFEFRRSAVARIAAQNLSAPAPTEEQKAWSAVAAYLIAPSMIDRQWRMSQPYLDYVVDVFRRHHVAVLIADICLGTLAPSANATYNRAHCRQLDGRISSWAERRGVPFLSLVPVISQAFKEHGAGELMIKDDGHPTKLTHALIEKAVRTWLVDQLR